MIRVLFVCLGNICRSPMAEAVFNHRVASVGASEDYACDSAGTGSWYVGESPHIGTQMLLHELGIPCRHQARQVRRADFERFDWIVAMDSQNLADIKLLGEGPARIALLLDFAPDFGYSDVPDPYYTGDFEETYRAVDAGVAGLIAHIGAVH